MAKATGVSTSAINYYVRMGLLPPPLKTHRNMAYYHPSYVQMINYIKRLQLQKHLPLERIKEIMAAKMEIWREIDRGLEAAEGAAEAPSESAKKVGVREKIMEAGVRLFSRKGYHFTTEKDIVNAAGVSMGEFYELYSGKEDLLMDLAEEGVRVFRARVAREIASVDDMLERIKIAIPVAFKLIVENREIYNLYLEGAVTGDLSFDRKLSQMTMTIAEDLRATIARGIRDGTIRKVNPAIAASAIMGQLVRLANFWMEDPLKHDIDEITQESIEFVTRALKPD
ncbi:MerR family transcriptional regulator [Candidatus Solincola sp.]|nr:MerR family transcriptional regulator [Actinomycetota bacterium]MDI7251695.1 MerR family transcriptional regulator [Actinomycetota bacterium]